MTTTLNTNHFEGGQNLSKGTRRGDDNILEELMSDALTTTVTELPAGGAGQGLDQNANGSYEIALGGGEIELFVNALVLAEALRVTMNAHAADGAEHTTAIDNVNFALTSPTATNVATLITLLTEMQVDFAAHLVDAQLAAAWAFHAAQVLGGDLATAVAPTTLLTAITVLNDLKAKFNTHEGSGVLHGAGSAHTEATADAVDRLELVNLSVDTDKLAADAVTKAKLDTGIDGTLMVMAVEDADTSTREENVAGLSSAITQAEALRVTLDVHAADGVEHVAGADATNFPLGSPTATTLPSLLVLVSEQLAAYEAHNADAVLGAAWVFHEGQQAGNTLADATAATSLVDAIAKIADLKAKYNTHESSAASHDVGSAHTDASVGAAYGAANLFPVAGVLPGDFVSWSILDSGTGTVTGVSAVAATAGITFTFDADPQNDAIISYAVFRTTT